MLYLSSRFSRGPRQMHPRQGALALIILFLFARQAAIAQSSDKNPLAEVKHLNCTFSVYSIVSLQHDQLGTTCPAPPRRCNIGSPRCFPDDPAPPVERPNPTAPIEGT